MHTGCTTNPGVWFLAVLTCDSNTQLDVTVRRRWAACTPGAPQTPGVWFLAVLTCEYTCNVVFKGFHCHPACTSACLPALCVAPAPPPSACAALPPPGSSRHRCLHNILYQHPPGAAAPPASCCSGSRPCRPRSPSPPPCPPAHSAGKQRNGACWGYAVRQRRAGERVHPRRQLQPGAGNQLLLLVLSAGAGTCWWCWWCCC